MARAHFVTYVHDTEGRPIPGATVEVRQKDSASLIAQTLYANDTPDMTPISNPFTADADGRLEAFVDTPDVVDFYITKAGYDPSSFRGTFHQLTASTQTFEDGGSPMPQRANIDFQDGFVLTDNAGANQTEIDLDYATTTELANVTKAAEAAGTSPKVARGDHKHDATTAAAGSSTAADAAAEGTSTSLARADHVHGREGYAAAAQIADVDAAAESAGVSATVARGDHKHDILSANPGGSVPGDSAAESAGGSNAISRADHRHGRESFATTTELADVSHAAESAGASGTVARGDHKHAASVAGTAELAPVAAAEAAGSSNTIPRGDHVHAHGTGYAGGHTDVAAHDPDFHTAMVAVAERSGDQGLTVDAFSVVSFNSTVLDTPGGGHDDVGNPSRLVALEDGYYRVTFQISFTAGSDVAGRMFIDIRENSAGSAVGGTFLWRSGAQGADTIDTIFTQRVLFLSNGEYVECFAQSTATDRNIDGANGQTFGMIERIAAS